MSWRQAPIGRRLRERAGRTCVHEQHRATGEANRRGAEYGAGSRNPTELVVEANAIHIKPSDERQASAGARRALRIMANTDSRAPPRPSSATSPAGASFFDRPPDWSLLRFIDPHANPLRILLLGIDPIPPEDCPALAPTPLELSHLRP